jgi:hypothetical protein
MTEQLERSGHCLCGSVTYTFTPAELEIDACHCGMCLRWGGGPALSVKATEPAKVTGKDNIAVYKSSEWGERQFCRTCGTHLFFHAPSIDYFGISAGTIDDLSGLALTTEIFIDKKPEAYAFANATRQFTEAEFNAMFSEAGKE